MKIKDKISYIMYILLSIISVLGLSMQMNMQEAKYTYFNSNTFMWLIIGIFYYVLSRLVMKIKDKRLTVITIITSIIIATLYMVGYMAENYFVPNIEINLSSAFLIFLLFRFIGCSYSLYLIMKIAFSKIKEANEKDKENKELSFFTNNKKSFFIVAGCIILAYIPYWLQYFPGIASADPTNQAMQVLGVYELTNHHPVLHSFFIFLCLKTSQFLTGSYTGTIGIYSAIQIMVMAMTFSFVLYYMAKRKIHRNYRMVCFLIFAFFPLFPLYAITLQKDILFAMSITILTIFIVEMCYNTGEFFKKKRNLIYLAISILGTMFFRNNGIYVIILSSIFLIITFRKYYKQLVPILLGGIVFYYIFTTWGYAKMNIKQGSVSEMLSIPLQYFARLEQRKSNELSEVEKEEIYRYLPVENIGDLYNPKISDGVKRYLDKEEFKKDKKGFIKLFVKLVLKDPIEAVESFVCGSYGYYYPDTQDWGLSTQIFESEREEEKELQWYQVPIIKSTVINEISNTVNEREKPIVSTLYSIGFVFWSLLICISYLIYRKEYKALLMFIPVIGVWMTSLASPVYGEMRYVLSMYTCIPIFFIFSTTKDIKIK